MATNQLATHWRRSWRTLSASWLAVLEPVFLTPEFDAFADWIDGRVREGVAVFPQDPYRMLRLIEPESVRVLILGQDPYHGVNQANGLAFSVPNDQKRPPSLRNILQEVAREYQCDARKLPNDLSPWVEQGVLLLNTSLTVELASPASHAKRFWERLTDAIVHHLVKSGPPKAFLLWGAHAQEKACLMDSASGHLVLQANHPSPLSASRPPVPFVGCGHFSLVNDWLVKSGNAPILWANPPQELF